MSSPHFAWPIHTYVEACGSNTYGVTFILLSSLCTHVLHFVVASARTLLGPDILMFTLCLDQLYSCTVKMLSSLCTPVQHFVVTSAHTVHGLVLVLYR